MVLKQPGKRTGCYGMMCPAGERRRRVNAALYQLLEEGRLCKQEPDGGRKMTPFWFPPGYTGPLGGTLSDADLGEGRALPLTEEKMVCYDILAESPGLTAREVQVKARAAGHNWEVKVINASLYAMEKDGTAQKSEEPTAHGSAIKKWSVVMA
jgi:hypothetical protein